MYARLRYLTVLPEHEEDIKKLYHDEIIPALREQKGFVDCRLLEPVNRGDQFIALTVWKRQSDAIVYESTEQYEEQRNKILSFTTGTPQLKTYTYETVAKEVHLVK